MRFRIGSQNPIKIAGVKAAVNEFNSFKSNSFESVLVNSGISHQPIGLEQTLLGAKNRAEHAFEKNAVSVGIEGGVIPIPFSNKALSTTAACVFDGEQFQFGISSSYELPVSVARRIVDEQIEMEQALFENGFSDDREIGQSHGFIALLTNNRLTRQDLVKQATLLALAKFEQNEKFG